MTRDIRLPGTGDPDYDVTLFDEREAHREADQLREDRESEQAGLEQTRRDLELLYVLAFLPAKEDGE